MKINRRLFSFPRIFFPKTQDYFQGPKGREKNPLRDSQAPNSQACSLAIVKRFGRTRRRISWILHDHKTITEQTACSKRMRYTRASFQYFCHHHFPTCLFIVLSHAWVLSLVTTAGSGCVSKAVHPRRAGGGISKSSLIQSITRHWPSSIPFHLLTLNCKMTFYCHPETSPLRAPML